MTSRRAAIQLSRRQRILKTVERVLGWTFVFLVVGLIVLFGSVLFVYQGYARQFVPPDVAAMNRPSSGATILDRNGQLLYKVVSDYDGIRNPIGLQDVGPVVLAATIAAEDASFFSNPGVNSKGLARAAWENFNPFTDDGLLKARGGSSITQQLVKNVYIPQDEREKRSLDRKLREIVFAVEITKRYSKEQILEWYLNQINYGGIFNGIEAAAQGYFGKTAKDLTLGEAALLAGLPQAPSQYDPTLSKEAAAARRNQVLDQMLKRGEIQIGRDAFFPVDPAAVEAARSEPIEVRPYQFHIEAPHFVLTYVLPRLEALFGRDAIHRDGLVVTTSLDLDLQNRAQDVLERWTSQFENVSNSRNGSLVILQPGTGEVLVMIGSRDYWRTDIQGEVNNALALNSPGSSFKPFVYMTSFIKLGWTPSSIVEDIPTSYRESNGTVFTPQNPNRSSYLGRTTVRQALGNSLNVPAFRTAMQLGVPSIVEMAKTMGFTGLDGFYGPSIAIGGVDLSLIDLVYGYATIANMGTMRGQNALAPTQPDEREIDPIAILTVVDRSGKVRFDVNEHRVERQVVGPEYPWMITSILTDPSAQCITFGCGGVTVPGYSVGVKTGTSEPYDPKGPNAGKIGDTWAFGYTADYVVGVWAGNSDNTPIVNIFSTSISFRAMRDAMLAAYSGRPQTPFPRPETVAQAGGDWVTRRPGAPPSAAAAQSASVDTARCNQMRGRPYASDSDRQYFLQNCAGQPTAGSASAAVSAGPDRTSCAEIQGTVYRSDSERAWFFQNCRR